MSGPPKASGSRRRSRGWPGPLGWLLWLVALLPWATLANEPPATVANMPITEATDTDSLVDFWGTGQGLPHNTVNALLQTRDGYLWVGTGAGLARFDGLVFALQGDELVRGLKDVPITALLEDRQGGLWVGTQGRGVLRLRPGKPLWLTADQQLADNAVTSLAEDNSGGIWIGTQNGLNRWQAGRLDTFSSPVIQARDSIVALHAGRSGRLWITTRSGVYYFQDGQAVRFQSEELPQGRNADFVGAYEDRSGDIWAFGATFLLNLTQGRRFNYFRALELSSSRVWTICDQNNGAFWIGTSGRGLFRFQNGRFEVIGARSGLDQCDVRALHADLWGNLWVGTSGNGLARLRTRHLRFVGAAKGLVSRQVTSLTGDGNDGLWVGTADAGLFHWDGRRAELFAAGPSLERLVQIQSVCRDGRGTLWVGTRGDGLWELAGPHQRRFTTADGLSDDVILSLAAGPDAGTLWIGTQAGNLHRLQNGVLETFTPAEGLPGSAILCLLFLADRQLAIGLESGGVVRWDGHRLTPMRVPRKLAGKPVRALFEDRRGRLWVGTWGAGAFCRQGEAWLEFSLGQGLASLAVGQIAQDETGDYWFGTDEGYGRVAALEMDAFLAGRRDTVTCLAGVAEAGLEEVKCPQGWPNSTQSTNGPLWLAVSTGVLPLGARERVLPEPAPPVILESVLVNGQPHLLETGAPLRLGPGASSLDFVFTAISFSSPQKVRFRHRLEQFDTDWVHEDGARRAHYGPLPPGKYRFHVIAGNADNVWNQAGATLDLVVVPPLWREGWFLTLSALAAVLGIWAIVRWISLRRLRAQLQAAEQQHAMERERARIAQDMHDEIGSKLTRISFLSEVARHAGAEAPAVGPPVEAIANTSRELLQALDEIVWAVNPRNDNLEQLAGYLEQYAREYYQATALECDIHVPPQLPRAALSAEVRHNVFLAFEEALNNTLKHAQATRVQVTMQLAPHAFEIVIADDGQGFVVDAPAQPEQDGLGNMRARLRLVGGACDITSQPGGGTTVRLVFPVSSPAHAPAEEN